MVAELKISLAQFDHGIERQAFHAVMRLNTPLDEPRSHQPERHPNFAARPCNYLHDFFFKLPPHALIESSRTIVANNAVEFGYRNTRI